MKNILCYGDSNTWGYVPGSFNFATFSCSRYLLSQRWTGRLQELLSKDYYVIEEGLNGRMIDMPNLNFADKMQANARNGEAFLATCLATHAPIDLVVLMLGLNDLQYTLQRSVQEVTQGMEKLIHIIQSSTDGEDMLSAPKILLVANPIIAHEEGFDGIFKNAIEKSKQLPLLWEKLAKKYNCFYLDASPYIEFSRIDGFHFDEEAHAKFAHLLAEKILSIAL